jgi:hypothetical protein
LVILKDGHPILFFLISAKDTDLIERIMKFDYKQKALDDIDEKVILDKE